MMTIIRIDLQNKRPTGHIAHLREQFKSINTYDYIITLIKQKNQENWMVFNMNKFESPSSKDALVEIGPVVLEKKIFKFCQCIFTISTIISPWKRVGPFIWTNLYPFHSRVWCFVPSLVEFGPVVVENNMKM